MNQASYSLASLVLYFLKLGAIGFGGPVALVGYMYRDLVESRRWITEDDYKEGLTLAQLMPGPLAAQLAMYLGYVHYRVWGATVAGIAFVLPSFLMVLAIGWAYVRYGGLPWMQAAFYGVGAAVIGIIAMSAYKLTAKNIGKDKLLWMIYLLVAAVTVWTESESVWLFLGAGLLVWVVRSPPKRLFGKGSAPALITFDPSLCAIAAGFDWSLLVQIGTFFAKAGAFVFGSGLAIVPFLYGKRPALVAFVDGVTAAAIGAITGAVVVLAERSIVDIVTAVVAVVTVVLIWKIKRLPEPVLVVTAALVGLIVFPILHS